MELTETQYVLRFFLKELDQFTFGAKSLSNNRARVPCVEVNSPMMQD